MSYTSNAQKLETARERLNDLTEQFTAAVQAGRDSYESIAKIAVLAKQRSLAERDLNEAASLVLCDDLSLDPEASEWNGFTTVRPNCPKDNADELAEWVDELAVRRSYGRTVDLRPMLAAE